ncbi:ureidoglycolate lyase [Labrys neptuniae]
MTNPGTILARPVTAENFGRFGAVYDLAAGTDPKIEWTRGNGWQDGFTKAPLIAGSGHLGMTHGGAAPWRCAEMERHASTEEAIFCASLPIVLAVAPASPAKAPCADAIEAFVISPGQAVVMKRGVWHDACRGQSEAAPYFWMAICGLEPSAWIPVEGGPVSIGVDATGLSAP